MNMNDRDTKTVEPFEPDKAEALAQIRRIVRRYLNPNKYKAFIYGSRAKGTNFRWSDVDIGILGEQQVPTMTYSHMEEAFEESNIPYVVELVDFFKVNPEFKKRAMERVIPLN
jgi:predicted nucleotidyltransferase